MNKKLLVLLALIVLGMNLRSPLTAVPPVMQSLQNDLGLNAILSGLLTSIPVLCFGLLTPLISVMILKVGIDKSLWFTLSGAALGLLFRPYTGEIGMLVGTLILGAALSTGNIVSLMLIGRDFRQQIGSVTGLYTASLNIGTMLTSSLTAPVAHVMGWQFALASWVWLPVLGLVLWQLSQTQQKRRVNIAPEHGLSIHKCLSPTPLRQKAIITALSIGFAAHLFIYYGATAWLPTYLISESGVSAARAGGIASVFQGLALVGAFLIPVLGRCIRYEYLMVAVGGCWAVSILLILFYPSFWMLWCFSGGIAQGGGFVVIFTLMMKLSPSLDDNRRISVIVQGVGYTLSSFGPILMGFIYEYFHEWSPSWGLLSGISLIIVISGMVIIGITRGKTTDIIS